MALPLPVLTTAPWHIKAVVGRPPHLSRRAETLEVPRPRRGRAPVHLLVDSTGLRLCGPGGWLEEKHGAKRRRAWRVLHPTAGAHTRENVAPGPTRQGGG